MQLRIGSEYARSVSDMLHYCVRRAS